MKVAKPPRHLQGTSQASPKGFTDRREVIPIACLSEIEQMKNLGGDGRLVESQKVPLSAFEYPMDLSSYAAGIYQIRLVSGDDSKSVKIVVE